MQEFMVEINGQTKEGTKNCDIMINIKTFKKKSWKQDRRNCKK